MQPSTSFLLSELLYLLITATAKTHPALGCQNIQHKTHIKEAVGHRDEIFNSVKLMEGLISALHLKVFRQLSGNWTKKPAFSGSLN